MASSSTSALIVDKGRKVMLRLEGCFYELSQESLREVLGVLEGPLGLGISIDQNRLRFEFAGEEKAIEMTAAQLRRRLARLPTADV
jgi:hypothetical protein